MSDFGTDFFCLEDFDDGLRFAAGFAIVRQAAFHRLTTPTLIENEDFGIDVRALLGKGYTAETVKEVQPLIDGILQRDDRILTSETTATLRPGRDPNEAFLILSIRCETAQGPFDLVLKVSDVTVEILNGGRP